MVNITLFNTLRNTYGSWNELSAHVQSPEGGSLRIIDSESELAIIRYDKGTSDFTNPTVSWFRSVVWNKTTNMPVCVAPPRTSPSETFRMTDEIICQEYLEGVMINVYKDDASPSRINIASRSSFGATGTFYSQRPFNELMRDAIKTDDYMDMLRNLLGNSDFMSILIQHPEHRVVEKVTVPRFYIVHMGMIDACGAVTINDCIGGDNAIPVIEHPEKDKPLNEWLSEQAENRGWSWQGVVFKNMHTGCRWRVRSNPYKMVRSLRGDSARTDVRFVRLRQQQLLDTYLFYYPEEREIYIAYEMMLQRIIRTLYNEYVAVHIRKDKAIDTVDAIYRAHMYALHGLYLQVLRPNKQFIRMKDVAMYVNIMQWQQLLFLMNRQ